MLCAFEAIRINQVSRNGGGFWEVGRDLWQAQTLFSGLAPLLLKMTTYTATQLTTYDLSTTYVTETYGALSFSARLLCALLAAVLASLASQPGDTVLSLMATQKEAQEGSKVSAALRQLGLEGCFMGWDARLAQMVIIVVVQLLTYDAVSAVLKDL